MAFHDNFVFYSPQQFNTLDEMLTGPFENMENLHKFYDVDNNNNQKQTQVIDEIDFELPYGIIGKLFDGYAYRRLQNYFVTENWLQLGPWKLTHRHYTQ